ncbi:hypothetical protein FRC10_000500 [Ceratobasidium sp. 414]|nr:hypothetical protein FRC10_000500 [Ceratobasidium sp. 414]
MAPRPAPTEPVRRRPKRRKGLSAMSDAGVQDEDDRDIIGLKFLYLDSERSSWRSSAYEHYNVALDHHFDALGEFSKLVLRFDCKYNSPHHDPPVSRPPSNQRWH